MTEKKKRFFESMYEIIDRKYGRKLQMDGIIDLLNEQQEMIDQLEKENTNLIELAEELGVKIEVVDDE